MPKWLAQVDSIESLSRRSNDASASAAIGLDLAMPIGIPARALGLSAPLDAPAECANAGDWNALAS